MNNTHFLALFILTLLENPGIIICPHTLQTVEPVFKSKKKKCNIETF